MNIKNEIKLCIRNFYRCAFDNSFKKYFISILIRDHSFYRYKLYKNYLYLI